MERFTIKLAERPETRPPEPPGLVGLAVVALIAAAPAWLFGMSPVAAATFVAGCVSTRAAKNHRRTQQALRVAAATVFCSFAHVTFMFVFPPMWRLVFFGALFGAAVAFYESGIRH